MKFEMQSYIAIDRETNFNGGKCSFADKGAILYPIGATVPVIRKSPLRCIGTAYIKSMEITENLTEVKFTFAPMDHTSEIAKAYLALYLNGRTENSDDPYSGEGVFIPGAMGIGGNDVSEPRPRKKGRMADRYRSLSDIMEDDDDDY